MPLITDEYPMNIPSVFTSTVTDQWTGDTPSGTAEGRLARAKKRKKRRNLKDKNKNRERERKIEKI